MAKRSFADKGIPKQEPGDERMMFMGAEMAKQSFAGKGVPKRELGDERMDVVPGW